jgi:hypothetical protein
MATTDKARFNRVLKDAEGEMDRLFGQMAREIGQVVMREAGMEGTVPVERLQRVQLQARQIVDRYFLGGPERRPFDEENQPQAAFPEVISRGQQAMIDMALERQAKLLKQHLPEDLRRRLVQLWLQR